MASEALAFPYPPTSTDLNDGGQSYGMGCAFTVSEAIECTGIRWRVPDSVSAPPGGTHVAALYVNGTRQRFANFTPTPGGDQDITFSSPITLSPGQSLVASVFTVHYTFRAGSGVFPVSNAGGQATATGSLLTATSTPADIPDVAGSSIFYVSPLLTVDSGPADVDGTGALALPPLVLSGTAEISRREAGGALTLPPFALTGTGTIANPDGPTTGEPAHGFPLRAQLADLLSDVEGVKGFIKRPVAPKVGNAWPRITGLERVAQGAWQTAWQVVVLIPQDEQKQDEWIVDHLDAIVDALADALWCASVEVGVSNDMPALLINGTE